MIKGQSNILDTNIANINILAGAERTHTVR